VKSPVRRAKNIRERKGEQGIIIVLVAVFLLFVVGAMAALAIDAVTLYTARSEAQLAADAAALAAARVLANSGMTSDPTAATDNLEANAWTLASAVALQVAQQNRVGGANLSAAEVTLPAFPGGTYTNPTVTVTVLKTDLPTFFARIWGSSPLTVKASATAEAYNPSGAGSGQVPVAPTCVKPWLLPNIDPTQSSATGSTIFNSATGAITAANLVGKGWPNAPVTSPNPDGLYALCGKPGGGGDCSTGVLLPSPGGYYPGVIEPDDFPAPTDVPACSAGFNSYQLAVVGCVPRPIRCGPTTTASVDIDLNPYVPNGSNRDADTVQAAKCLIHDTGVAGNSDSIDSAAIPSPPFQFLGGNQNPVAGAVGKDVLVSDSLVTIPVFDSTGSAPGPTVDVIGFLQVFLNPLATKTLPLGGPASPNEIPATIINIIGCGTRSTGTPILGNGASPVAVRLITP
jgi:Flp pilus assembly protein TadG